MTRIIGICDSSALGRMGVADGYPCQVGYTEIL
jgi:hypothetical protein